MLRALERIFSPASGLPEWPTTEPESELKISVVFTQVEPTLGALKHAGVLARNLGARISLLAPQVVPYPLPLDDSPVSPEFNERRFRVIAGQSRVEAGVEVCLCRDRMEALKALLKTRSLVVVGGHKGHWPTAWWPSSEKRLVAGLRRAGHEVIFWEME